MTGQSGNHNILQREQPSTGAVTGHYPDGRPILTFTANAVDALPAGGVYNVLDYGAMGDGVTDDRAAIQAALDACHLAGGGIVDLLPGVYLLNSTVTTSLNGCISCLVTYADVTLRGAGRDATTLRLGANLPDLTRGIVNYNNNTGGAGDTSITLRDFTLDGNNANQSSANAQSGIFLQYTQGTVIERVRVLNIYGTGSSGASEGFFCTIDTSSDARVIACTCLNTGTNASSGFSANYSTNLAYTDCTSSGMTHSMGFTNYGCTHVSHSGCMSYTNALHGFNTEVGVDIEYVNCHGGISAASQGGFNSFPFTSGQVLGNTADGYHVRGSQRVSLTNCVAENNGGNGVTISVASTEGIAGQYASITGGSYSSNTGYALACDASATGYVVFTGRPRITSNTAGSFSVFVNGVATAAYAGGQQPLPTVPASTTALLSPFPIPSWVIISGGTVTAILLNGASVATATPEAIFVPPGSTLAITYSAVPSWAWHALFM